MAHPGTTHMFLELVLFEGAALVFAIWQLWEVRPRRDAGRDEVPPKASDQDPRDGSS